MATFATECAMKLKDLTVELSGNDTEAGRTLKIGPLKNGLNFVYGEKGSGKTTLRNVVGELLLDSVTKHPLDRKSIGCHSISMVLEHGSNRYRISRDSFGVRTTTRLKTVGSALAASEYVYDSFCDAEYLKQQFPALESDLINNLTVVGFRDAKTKLKQLYEVLHEKFDVPVGEEASFEASSGRSGHDGKYQAELKSQIDILQLEIDKLLMRRVSFNSEVATKVSANELTRKGLQSRIEELQVQLHAFDSDKISAEIVSLQNEESRIRAEIENARKTVSHDESRRQSLVALYRLLDEIEMQFRETRVAQTNVQRHRVKLKEEMQRIGSLTIDEQLHPYRSVREIIRRIESHVNDADDRGDQWADDFSTEDNRQFSRFLDEKCRDIREELSLLCEEVSCQYRDSRNRTATNDLKELRQNYNFVSDCVQRIRSRRDKVISEIQNFDRLGAEKIIRSDAEYCRFAAQHGHWAARVKFLGEFTDESVYATQRVHSPNTLQEQQLQSIECRLKALQHSLVNSTSQSERIRNELNELTRQLHASAGQTQPDVEIAQIDARISKLRAELQPLKLQLHHVQTQTIQSNALLTTAGNILQHLTGGDFSRVWLEQESRAIRVATPAGERFDADALTERGLAQLVQLALVLASSECCAGAEVPLIFDDLIADLEKRRTDSVIQTIHRWCQETVRQIILLTQHRFLADRIPDAPVWEIENVKNVNNWQPATREMLQHAQYGSLLDATVEPPEVFGHAATDHPVAEYPQGPWPRPYPLSKYPRTTDRQRMDCYSCIDLMEHESTPWGQESEPYVDSRLSALQPAAVVSPAAIGEPIPVSSIDEDSRIDSVSIFDNAQLRALADCGVNTVSDFLTLESSQTSAELSASYLSGESLERLQAAVWLLICIPGLYVNDAQALVACGISEPQHLLTSNVESLFQRLTRFLRSPDGRQFLVTGRTLTVSLVQSWQSRLRDSRRLRNQHQADDRRTSELDLVPNLRAYSPRERKSDLRASDFDRKKYDRENYREPRPIRSPRMRTPQSYETHASESTSPGERSRRAIPRVEPARPRSSRSDSVRKPTAVRHPVSKGSITKRNEPASSGTSAGSEKLRFYLELTDHIEAAPSIGPRTAERFEAIEVSTIADFLKMTAESLAEKLNYKRLNAKLLRQWQHQARLVCRIPNLRGHDAQLLVGCGIIEAEEIASMRPESLFDLIGPFSDTKEGMKIIRNGKKPDMNEVTDWIRFAQHNRSLRAA